MSNQTYNWEVSNYCACFIDLLGQQDQLKGQGVIPAFSSKDAEQKFYDTVRTTIGAIDALQNDAQIFRKQFHTRDKSSPTYIALSKEDKKSMDIMRSTTSKQQRWSDGLVYFSSLKTKRSGSPMNAVIDIFFTSGTLCLLGLAKGIPLRGAIDIAWGVELHENELYGAVVAKAYNLESNIAQYPRIVVGSTTIEYLESIAQQASNDKLSSYNQHLANYCLSFISQDLDGYFFIDYLSKSFSDAVMQEKGDILYHAASKFIGRQYQIHVDSGNSKLASRYHWLRTYYDAHIDQYTKP